MTNLNTAIRHRIRPHNAASAESSANVPVPRRLGSGPDLRHSHCPAAAHRPYSVLEQCAVPQQEAASQTREQQSGRSDF